MKISYRFGLYVSFFIIIIIPILLELVLFKNILIKSAKNEFYSEAAVVAHGILNEINKKSSGISSLSGKYVRDKIIVSSITKKDIHALEARLVELFRYSRLDLIEVGNTMGVVLARGHRPGKYGENKNSQTIIKYALSGKPATDFEYGASGLALRSVSPVRSHTNRIIGTLMTGILMDRDLLQRYKMITGFDIALFEKNDLISTTYKEGISWLPPPLDSIRKTAEKKIEFNTDNSAMWGIYVPVYHATGLPFGGLLVWKNTETILAPLKVNRITLMVCLFTGLVLAFLFSTFLSRSFYSPLMKILGVMDRIAVDKISTDIPNCNWKEFRELYHHFSNMIEKLRRSREKLEKTNKQLVITGKLAVLGQVTAELAHEVRNPLNSIGITTRLISEKLKENNVDIPEINDKIRMIRSEIKRLNQTIIDFINAGGEIRLKKEKRNLAEEIRNVIRLASPQIKLLGIKLETDIKDSIPLLFDRNRFHQALLNLILNACQAMQAGGLLNIHTHEDIEKISVVVKDNGPGIDSHDIEKITSFSFTTQSKGLGCGLSYVLRIMRAHNGEFDIKSVLGKGTTVIMRFYKNE